MKRSLPVVVFSSLDAIPVDSDQSLSEEMVQAVDRLKDEAIPLVFHSNKTRAQLECISQDVDIRHPFIAENGGAVFIPHGYFGLTIPNARAVAGYRAIEFGRPYRDVVEALHRAADRLHMKIVGFSDMSIEEVALECGLSLPQARLAKLREYDEPFRILLSAAGAQHQLADALRAANIGCSTQGRYEHAGARVEPATGVDVLCALYRRTVGSPLTIGLGHRVEDAGWLRRMDISLIVDSADGDVRERLIRHVPKARVTTATGMTGWADAVVATLDAIRQQGDFDLSVRPTARQPSH